MVFGLFYWEIWGLGDAAIWHPQSICEPTIWYLSASDNGRADTWPWRFGLVITTGNTEFENEQYLLGNPSLIRFLGSFSYPISPWAGCMQDTQVQDTHATKFAGL